MKWTIDEAEVQRLFPKVALTKVRVRALWDRVVMTPRGAPVPIDGIEPDEIPVLLFLARELAFRQRDYALNFAAHTKRHNYPRSYNDRERRVSGN